MTVFRSVLLLFLVLFLQGCTYSKITDYSNCVSKDLTFEFKDDLSLFIIDDSKGENKYSSMNFPNDEHYICIGRGDQCVRDHKGLYYKGWKLIPLRSEPFHLTSRYKTNVPNSILGIFAPDTSALQAEIAGKNVWLPVYVLDEYHLKKSSTESIRALNKNTRMLNGRIPIFECPNENVKEDGSEKVWFN
jgi:hypothetical protein